MAIARDNATQINGSGAWSDWNLTGTWSHTCTGTNRILLVGIETQPAGGGPAEVLTSVTYNGNAMTQLVKRQRSDGYGIWQYLYWIGESGMPASGNAANVVATVSSRSDYSYGGSASYTGAAQTAPTNKGGADSITTTCTIVLTTVVDNSWLSGLGFSPVGQPITASTNTAEFNTILSWGRMFDTNAAQVVPGVHSMVYTCGTSMGTDAVFLACEVEPAGSAAASTRDSRELSLLGVG